MPATDPSIAPMSALAARKARALAAAQSEVEAAAASSSNNSQKSLATASDVSCPVEAEVSGSVAAGTRSRAPPRDVHASRRHPSQKPEASDGFVAVSDPNPSHSGGSHVLGPARKRAKAARTSEFANISARTKPTESRTRKDKARARYFANGSGETSASRIPQHSAISPVPVENADTGFLAFGDAEDEEAVVSSESKANSDDEGMSSDDESRQDIDDMDSTERAKHDRRPLSPDVLSRSRTSSAEFSPSAEFTKTIGPTIPYSRFVVDLDRNCLIHTMSPKQKHADAYTFGMHPGESLTFVGIGHVEVLKGLLQIGGAILSSTGNKKGVSAVKVFAPTYHPLPLLKAVDCPAEDFASPNTFPESFAASTFATIVRITPLQSALVDVLQVCAVGGITPPFTAPANVPLLKIPSLPTLKMLLEPDAASLTGQQQYFLNNNIAILAGLSATYIPNAWQTALNNLSASVRSAAVDDQEDPVVALIRGAKKVGKSTLSRTMLERILTMGQDMGGKVAFLELDVGQSDFGPPGMVSLHVFDADEAVTIGPGWVQPRVPFKAHFIGDLSPKDDPTSYMDAIIDLVTFFRGQVRPNSPASSSSNRMPLVVNTQGWIKGLGADLASRIETFLCPTHIFEVVPRGSVTPVPNPIRGSAWLDAEGAIVAAGAEIVTLESVNQIGFVPGVFNSKQIENPSALFDSTGPGDGGPVPPPYITDSPSRLTPADLRLLNIMAYLYAQDLGKKPGNILWDFSQPLVACPPLVVEVESGLKAGIRVLSFGSSIPDALKLAALNTSLVGIVAQYDMPKYTSVDEKEEVTRAKAVWKKAFQSGAEALVPGSQSQCLGLGIVRSIDVLRSEVHLLTPLSAEILSSFPALGLVKGSLDLPIWASLDYDAIKDAKESKLDVAPPTFISLASAPQQTLAGVPRNKVPYVEWPWTPSVPRTTLSSHGHATSSAVNAKIKKPSKTSRQQQSSLATLGSQKRKVRRNLMRRGQFA